jgi:hypothetical protein
MSELFLGLDVSDTPAANLFVLKALEQSRLLFRSFKYQNAFLRESKTGERIFMLTKDSWFLRVNEKLMMRCLQELAHVRYVPGLNLKTTEETHRDMERLKKNKGKIQGDFEAYYINLVEEISKITHLPAVRLFSIR